jgi:hypothetical protein
MLSDRLCGRRHCRTAHGPYGGTSAVLGELPKTQVTGLPSIKKTRTKPQRLDQASRADPYGPGRPRDGWPFMKGFHTIVLHTIATCTEVGKLS